MDGLHDWLLAIQDYAKMGWQVPASPLTGSLVGLLEFDLWETITGKGNRSVSAVYHHRPMTQTYL